MTILGASWQQHPKVRNLPICIECRGEKAEGLLLCWDCHDTQKRLNARQTYDYHPALVQCFDLIQAGKADVILQGDEKGRVVRLDR